MYENALYDVSDGIATITLNRPDKLNAYTTEMGEEVVDAFRRSRDDAAVRAVILTGAGRGFCAGVDLDHLKAHQRGGNVSKGPKLDQPARAASFILAIGSITSPRVRRDRRCGQPRCR